MLKNFNFEKSAVVEIVNEILVDATKRGASDIHFDPYEDYVKVRIRIDGDLMDYTIIPENIEKNLITRIKIISGMNITESRLPQDGAIKATLEGINMDMRVSAIPTNNGEKIVIRILDYSLSLAGLESLGFSQKNLKKVLKMIESPNGIVLVTGATGTGKSTTVYSILQKLNKENTNIITVEDPIEMNINGINQIQTNSEIGLDFATVLRSILRQDPNIIMIGEIRDTETAKIAVRASITGHLVLSTIHTNDSLNTIERLLDMGVERYLLASSLTGIISQKLARRLCPHCRKLRPTNDYEKNLIKKVTGKDVNEIYTTVGCDICKNGYSGRIAIHEVLLINQDIKDAISSNMKKEKLRHLVYSSDVISLLRDGIEKVLDGQTTLEELLKLIELDDDEFVHSTGLGNAIEATEITQSSENNHESHDISEDKLDKIDEDIFDVNKNETSDDSVIPNSDIENENDYVDKPTVTEANEEFNNTSEDKLDKIDEDIFDVNKEDEISDDSVAPNSDIENDSVDEAIETISNDDNNKISVNKIPSIRTNNQINTTTTLKLNIDEPTQVIKGIPVQNINERKKSIFSSKRNIFK